MNFTEKSEICKNNRLFGSVINSHNSELGQHRKNQKN